ncbi:D-sedoheptulose 7-phosphate isomerase [Mucilaginibacter rubeus]|jgi:D-sedoheptulose 7-phosphate isomerase|uniref:SIS domain-containing protein n=1 Tax=Mucilaginibacter rubeus TaxID=2027860 RepID=A0AAE6JAJ8_9SPHI|nr:MULTISPECIES: SIS domain-containing protein [Mucilaginibacter]QEM02052.1 SIS domain-containing protein [Mucilaginibacter rubeus]QEM14677.1 SIS domain-containing protein [Mucilaginibacter gossypii]QTE42615.1 SIS domain-containing protein [Mucilaginibacter rubeus]QTE49216.1 SIS domain-containing protein [Mucilaginibacter rubeus]QTE54313.1 SIS domain-containing protein [Mucilaginibacter rubeus]
MERQEKVKNYLGDYIARLTDILNKIEVTKLEQVITAMITAFKNGNTIYVVGNGGSAATASHMQADFRFFVRYFSKFRPKIIALTDNVPMITAIGNDNNFDDVFVEQMRGQFVSGDILIAISASGNSPNLVKAAEFANELGGTTIAFVGFLGGKLNEISSIPLYTPNPKGDYGPIEDVHMILNHIIVNYLSTDEEFLALTAN